MVGSKRAGRKLKMAPVKFDNPYSVKAKLYASFNGDYSGWAIRKKNWKLRYKGQTDEYLLYNLADDKEEADNLAASHTEIVNELIEEFNKWHDSVSQE